MGLHHGHRANAARGVGRRLRPQAASVEDNLVSRILNWAETIAPLTKNGLLDPELVLDGLWISGMWSRVGPAAVKLREKLGVPELYENFEALANKQV